ncbi:MAG TPA: delta-aminolevulinic acid dehydratase, partial [Blastocatellia bacterium]|nr:delta-aminolevulinic acid dehydratase [Blastocatellia bacterium]
MHDSILEQAFDDLFQWCRRREFAGYDPFDALNSRVFQATPLRHSRAGRLILTQLLKRSPLNLRPLAFVPRQKNAKGIALFALAALSNYRRTTTNDAGKDARELLGALLRMRIQNYSGAAWGYNFDWQSRNFFAPQGTPTIVPTAFAARALIEGYKIFSDERYLQAARSSCDFILRDLKRTVESDEEVCFSYSPSDETKIFNASLLAAETLAGVSALTGETELYDLAGRAARYVVRRQRDDGSWAYGEQTNQSWTDNFHTAYVLLSLSRI